MKKIIVLLLAVLPLMLSAQTQQRQVVDGIVAVVGQTIIKNSDIEQAYTQIRLRQGLENAHAERCQLLESMLISKLMVHKGIVDSVEVTDDQVEEQVQYYLKAAVRRAGGKNNCARPSNTATTNCTTSILICCTTVSSVRKSSTS